MDRKEYWLSVLKTGKGGQNMQFTPLHKTTNISTSRFHLEVAPG